MPEYSRPPGERVAQAERPPELQEFLRATQDAYATAQRYDGTEDSFKDFFADLERAADAAQRIPGVTGSSLEREAQAAQMLEGELKGVDIQSLLAVAGEQAQQRVRSAFDFDGTETSPKEPLFIKRVGGIILPPGDAPDRTGSGETVWEPTRFEPRVQEIRQLLEDEGIFADDYVITIGEVSKDMMRKASYVIIEIPRLQRTILVCDQVGEATFILRGHFSPETLTTKTKEQLQTEFPDSVRKLVRFDAAQWAAEIKLLLLSEDLWKKTESSEVINSHKKEKVDVRLQDRIREAFLQDPRYDSAEKWLALSVNARAKIHMNGYGIHALKTVFAINGNIAGGLLPQLDLGLAIYGQDNAAIQKAIEIEKRTPDQWRAAILADPRYDSAEKWITLGMPGRKKIEIDGAGLHKIATVFGIDGLVVHNRLLTQLQLGAQIYGLDNPVMADAIQAEAARVLLEEETKKYTPDQWRSAILADPRYDSAEKWVALDSRDIVIKGNKIISIATAFGIGGNAKDDRLVFLQLGLAIYGQDNAAIQKAIEIEKRTPDQWRAAILADPRYDSAEKWVALGTRNRGVVHIDGAKIGFLGTLFGTTGNLFTSALPQLQLGLKIYGEQNPVILDAIRKLEVKK